MRCWVNLTDVQFNGQKVCQSDTKIVTQLNYFSKLYKTPLTVPRQSLNFTYINPQSCKSVVGLKYLLFSCLKKSFDIWSAKKTSEPGLLSKVGIPHLYLKADSIIDFPYLNQIIKPQVINKTMFLVLTNMSFNVEDVLETVCWKHFINSWSPASFLVRLSLVKSNMINNHLIQFINMDLYLLFSDMNKYFKHCLIN